MKLQYINNQGRESFFPVKDDDFDIVLYENNNDSYRRYNLCMNLEEHFNKIFYNSYFSQKYPKTSYKVKYEGIIIPYKSGLNLLRLDNNSIFNRIKRIKCSDNIIEIHIGNEKFETNSIFVDLFRSPHKNIGLVIFDNKESKIQIESIWEPNSRLEQLKLPENYRTPLPYQTIPPTFTLNKDYIYHFHLYGINTISKTRTSNFKLLFSKIYRNITHFLLFKTLKLPPELCNNIVNYFNDLECVVFYCQVVGIKYDIVSLLPLFFSNIRNIYFWIGYTDFPMFLEKCCGNNSIEEKDIMIKLYHLIQS